MWDQGGGQPWQQWPLNQQQWMQSFQHQQDPSQIDWAALAQAWIAQREASGQQSIVEQPPGMIRSPIALPVKQEPPQIDAVKRRTLPAWIREGLEKMEREKQKKLEKERMEQQRSQLSKKEKKATEDSEGGDGPRLPQRSKFMLLTKMLLTEILLDVTDEEIYYIAKDAHRKATKAPAKQLAQSSALASLTGLGGLGGYGSGDSEDERSDRGSESSDTDDEELRHRIRQKQEAFWRKEKEQQLLHDKQMEEEKQQTERVTKEMNEFIHREQNSFLLDAREERTFIQRQLEFCITGFKGYESGP
ncbi:PREDICTED: arginine/serine-rich protein PNISR [Elephantulus edwardii]|uniref:arginine/serine-rich protein PNISR n=1 Tax=Elephantulus edwardii TaxID=28737 RepID=UPI0003F0C4C8|nr:PREDICTED: arginine/serine-rich protein PNISR [Elephantulus edwardii]